MIGNPIIESIQITPHFHSGMGKGCNSPARYWCVALTCWHFGHVEMYSTTSFFIMGQTYFFLSFVMVFWYHRCSKCGTWWISSTTSFSKFAWFGIYNPPLKTRRSSSYSWYPSHFFLTYFATIFLLSEGKAQLFDRIHEISFLSLILK